MKEEEEGRKKITISLSKIGGSFSSICLDIAYTCVCVSEGVCVRVCVNILAKGSGITNTLQPNRVKYTPCVCTIRPFVVLGAAYAGLESYKHCRRPDQYYRC